MRWPIAVVWIILIASLSPAAAPPALGSDTPVTAAISPARAAVEGAVDQILSILRDSTLSKEEKNQRIKAIATEQIDFDVLSRLAVGPGWKDLTDAQRAEFIAEFKRHVLFICTEGTDQYKDEQVIIVDDRQESPTDWTVLTRIHSKNPGGKPDDVFKLDFRVRRQGDHWQVIDLTIEGVSLAGTFRTQFAAISKVRGFDGLLQLMRDKNAASEKAAANPKPQK